MRLIDADAIVYTHAIARSIDDGHNWNELCVTKDEIEDIPSAEPKRGEWIPVDSYTAFGGDEMTWLAHGNPIAYHYCSECKNHAYALEDGEDLLSDFCTNCGAEMTRGE